MQPCGLLGIQHVPIVAEHPAEGGKLPVGHALSKKPCGADDTPAYLCLSRSRYEHGAAQDWDVDMFSEREGFAWTVIALAM